LFKFPIYKACFIHGFNFFYCCRAINTLHGYHTECMTMQVERVVCIKCLTCNSNA
jgi:hypothetical protein